MIIGGKQRRVIQLLPLVLAWVQLLKLRTGVVAFQYLDTKVSYILRYVYEME